MKIKELKRILTSKIPSIEIKNREEEIFDFIPELQKCKGFNQKNVWHPYDIYEHTLHVIDYVENNEILRMAALFHDLGKPEVYEEDKYGIGHFPKHWFESKGIFERFAEDNDYDEEKTKTISKLILYHDLNYNQPLYTSKTLYLQNKKTYNQANQFHLRP